MVPRCAHPISEVVVDDFVTPTGSEFTGGWNPLEHCDGSGKTLHVDVCPCPECVAVDIPDDCCPDCTKDLDERGWCFECRDYPRGEKEPV